MRALRSVRVLAAVGLLAAPLALIGAPAAASAGASAVPIAAVAQTASAVSLTSSAATVWEAAAGTITATVKPVAPARGVATGAVDFYDDGSYVATVPLGTTGKAKLPTNMLFSGVHSITADYGGDTTFAMSTTVTPLVLTVLANTPVAGASFTPSTVAPGAVTRLVVSATNTGGTRLNNVALGAMVPSGYRVVSMPRGQLCGARPGLFYCVTSIPVGGTTRFVLELTAGTVPGDFSVNAYARNIDTGNETYATATLTVA